MTCRRRIGVRCIRRRNEANFRDGTSRKSQLFHVEHFEIVSDRMICFACGPVGDFEILDDTVISQ